ncbi:hypothetical protein H8959_005965, partial [Pygathrix nigripes]
MELNHTNVLMEKQAQQVHGRNGALILCKASPGAIAIREHEICPVQPPSLIMSTTCLRLSFKAEPGRTRMEVSTKRSRIGTDTNRPFVEEEIQVAIRTLEMKGFLPLAWFLACSVPAVQGGLLDLKSMIEKVTGKNALTNYGFYGCYCGWGGRGTPKDGTD